MPMSAGEPQEPFLDRAERRLESSSTRLLLTALIIVSLLPEEARHGLLPEPLATALDPIFFAIFGGELLLRCWLYARRWRERRARGFEPLLLLLDLLAVLSFLPHGLFGEPESFRLLRLTRLLLLLGYWGRMGRDLLEIVGRRERRYQLLMVLLLGLVLSFSGAVLIAHLSSDLDVDGDGVVDARDHEFSRVLWWSFRQVQDSGNLVVEPAGAVVVAVSLLLTFAGVLLFSFVVGIGTTVVGELVERSRSQPVGLRWHTVILGFTPASLFLLEGLAEIYRKNLRPFRAAVLGNHPRAAELLRGPLLRTFRYRQGDSVRAEDLDRVDLRHAKRVLVLATDDQDPDGGVVASILAVRERHPTVDLYPDLEHERNFLAARAAGGPRTHLVGSGPFLGYFLAQNLVYPGIHQLYRQLLSSEGCEIYTYVFTEPERATLAARANGCDPLRLWRWARQAHGVTVLGLFAAADAGRSLEVEDLEVVLHPIEAARRQRPAWLFDSQGQVVWPAVRGLIGLALRWEELRRLSQLLAAGDPMDPRRTATGWPAALGGLKLDLPRGPIEHLLICGANPRVPRIVTELAGYYPRLEVTLVVREEDRLGPLGSDLRTMLESVWGPARLETTTAGFELRLEAGERRLRVHGLAEDWSNAARLHELGARSLETADAVLLLPEGERGEARDGTVALDALHLTSLARAGEVGLRPDLRLVGLMADPFKSELLASRLEQLSRSARGIPTTILSGERARYQFMMQNVFVRGLNAVYLELLSGAGHQLGRLVVRADGEQAPRGEVDPEQLAEFLLETRELLLIGVELATPGGAEVRFELGPKRPPASRPDARWEWSQLTALYVLGEWQAVVGEAA